MVVDSEFICPAKTFCDVMTALNSDTIKSAESAKPSGDCNRLGSGVEKFGITSVIAI
jgi:hypothetical protein